MIAMPMSNADFILIAAVALDAGPTLFSTADAASGPSALFRAVGPIKVFLIVFLLVFGVIASIFYLVSARPRMVAEARRERTSLNR